MTVTLRAGYCQPGLQRDNHLADDLVESNVRINCVGKLRGYQHLSPPGKFLTLPVNVDDLFVCLKGRLLLGECRD